MIDTLWDYFTFFLINLIELNIIQPPMDASAPLDAI